MDFDIDDYVVQNHDFQNQSCSSQSVSQDMRTNENSMCVVRMDDSHDTFQFNIDEYAMNLGDDELQESDIDSVSVITVSSAKSNKKSDFAIKMGYLDITLQDLQHYDCPPSCHLGRSCTQRCSIGEIYHMQTSFWGNLSDKITTKQRGEKVFAVLLAAKYLNPLNQQFGLQFLMYNPREQHQRNLVICEGKGSY